MKSALLMLAIVFITTGCASSDATSPAAATAAVVPTLTPPSAASRLTGYEFPASIPPASRYMFYLHGKIIEDVGLPAVSPDYGDYEYAAILQALEGHGFVVISEQRPKDTDADAYSRKVIAEIDALLRAGVPPANITVVGASKGAAIAATVSFLLNEPALNYVLLATCHPDSVEQWMGERRRFHGNVLTIRDVADTEYSGSCEELFRLSEGEGLGWHEELVLQVGTGHGILYQPLDDWILPTVQWAAE